MGELARGWTPDEASEDLIERVHDLLHGNAVALVETEPTRIAVVNGGSGWYEVHRNRGGMTCDCTAAETGNVCAHMLAAGVVMAEHAYAMRNQRSTAA